VSGLGQVSAGGDLYRELALFAALGFSLHLIVGLSHFSLYWYLQ